MLLVQDGFHDQLPTAIQDGDHNRFLSIYVRYVLGIASNGAVGWDPVSIFGRWVIGITLLIFGLGCSAGFWFLSKRLHR